MRGGRLFLASVIFGVNCMLAVSPSLASASSPTIPFARLDVTLLTEGSNNVLLATGELPETTVLPADVEIRLPADLQFQWAGEVLGGEVTEDLEVTPKIQRVGEANVYTFRLTKSRAGQIEVIAPDAVRFDGKAYQVRLAYTPDYTLKTLTLNVRIPRSSAILVPFEGAERSPGYETYDFYHRTVEPAEADAEQTLAFAYGPSESAETTGSGPNPEEDGSSAAFIVMSIAAVLILVAAFAIFRKWRAGQRTD